MRWCGCDVYYLWWISRFAANTANGTATDPYDKCLAPGDKTNLREADAMAVKLFCLFSLILVGFIVAGVV